MKITPLFIVLFFSILLKVNGLAQSPYRIFALDCHLNNEIERQTASLVTKAILLNHIDFIKASGRLKPFAPVDWKAFQQVIDSLHAKLPADGEMSWEEDYGLKTEGEKHEKWKELTFYESKFEQNGNLKAIVKGERRYILQVLINIDNNGQIENIVYRKGKAIIPREANILHSYKILYKPDKK
jgi:hypothetical protein